MRFILCILFLCLAGAASLWAYDNYSCSGTGPCDEDCLSDTVSCSLSGSAEGGTNCQTEATGEKITCKVYQDGELIGETTSNCLGCDSYGGADPPSSGCDPSDPLYWLYCDPFAV